MKIHGFLRVKAQPLVIASAVCITVYSGAGGGRCWCLPAPLSLQEAEIDSIHQLVVGATENIKEGNEDIREVGAREPESYHVSGRCSMPETWH